MQDFQGRNVALEWYKFGLEKKDDFFIRFMMHWVAFNWLYNKYVDNSEIRGIREFCENNLELLSDFDAFSLDAYASIAEEPIIDVKKGKVRDDHKIEHERMKKEHSIPDLLLTLYRIRCNLFHGNKSIANSRDKSLVKASAEILEGYMRAYFESQHMYQDPIESDVDRDSVTYCEITQSHACHNKRHNVVGVHYLVDRDIVPILAVLHRKGYRTKFSCSGHLDNIPLSLDTHIVFKQQYSIVPPEGFHLSEIQGNTRIGVFHGRKYAQYRMNEKEARVFLANNIGSLQDWADALPPVYHHFCTWCREIDCDNVQHREEGFHIVANDFDLKQAKHLVEKGYLVFYVYEDQAYICGDVQSHKTKCSNAEYISDFDATCVKGSFIQHQA